MSPYFSCHKKADHKFIKPVVDFPNYMSNSIWMNYHVTTFIHSILDVSIYFQDNS